MYAGRGFVVIAATGCKTVPTRSHTLKHGDAF